MPLKNDPDRREQFQEKGCQRWRDNTNRFQFPTQEHTHQSATEVDAESDTPPENLHEDQSAREVDAESNTPPENLHEDWNILHPISGPRSRNNRKMVCHIV